MLVHCANALLSMQEYIMSCSWLFSAERSQSSNEMTGLRPERLGRCERTSNGRNKRPLEVRSSILSSNGGRPKRRHSFVSPWIV